MLKAQDAALFCTKQLQLGSAQHIAPCWAAEQLNCQGNKTQTASPKLFIFAPLQWIEILGPPWQYTDLL